MQNNVSRIVTIDPTFQGVAILEMFLIHFELRIWEFKKHHITKKWS